MWSVRGARKYYYRRRTVLGHRSLVYVGTGEKAEIEAKKDAEVREKRLAAAKLRRAELDALKPADEALMSLSDLTKLVTQSSLTALGFYELDRGKWVKVVSRHKGVKERDGEQSDTQP